jgi:predicted nucleotidyltransferase
MLSDATIRDAAELLASAARGPVRVILFGSHARGEAGPTSDLDLLVIDKHDAGHFEEMVRLRAVLPPLGVPVDVVVLGEELVASRQKVPGTMVHAAMHEGRIVAES